MVDTKADRHRDQLHGRRADEDPDLARSVRADAHGAGRARRPRQHRRQRDRPAVELRVEGHAAAGCGLDDGRRRDHRHGARPARRRPTSTTTTSTKSRCRPPATTSSSGPAASASTSSSSAAPTCSTAACAATSTTTSMECVQRARRAGGAAASRHDDRRPQQADLRLRLRPRRADHARQGVVLRLATRSRTSGWCAAPARWSTARS